MHWNKCNVKECVLFIRRYLYQNKVVQPVFTLKQLRRMNWSFQEMKLRNTVHNSPLCYLAVSDSHDITNKTRDQMMICNFSEMFPFGFWVINKVMNYSGHGLLMKFNGCSLSLSLYTHVPLNMYFLSSAEKTHVFSILYHAPMLFDMHSIIIIPWILNENEQSSIGIRSSTRAKFCVWMNFQSWSVRFPQKVFLRRRLSKVICSFPTK